MQAAPGQCGSPGESITIDGVNCDVTELQRELTKNLADQLQVETTEAFKVVYQQTRIGVVDLDVIIRAYLQERTSLLLCVRSLFCLEASSTIDKANSLARDVVMQIKARKDFSLSLVQGVRKRLDQPMPPKIAANPKAAVVWSRQLLLEEYQLLEILFALTSSVNISVDVVKAWFALLRDSSFLSSQRHIRMDADEVTDILQRVQALSAVLSIQMTSLPETDLGRTN